ncbi:MAG: IclR family transcriptional regulator [Deltaproteobacteria bacterium]|nr:IclR family transcriptional regulator [Deltaproteobacteria bacterium]
MVLRSIPKSTKPKNFVQSVERISKILDVLGEFPQGLSIGDLSTKIGLPKGTIHRLLSTLVFLDYVRQDAETKRYNLGFKLVELGNRLLSHIDFRTEARPYLLDLAENTRETVHLVILYQDEVLYIEKMEANTTPTGLRMVSMLGSRVPAHCTAVGKVLLAALPEDKLETMVGAKGLTRRTENTITSLEKLKEHLQEVRRTNCAFDMEENEIGICCVAAPIRDQQGYVIAAISISGPVSRINARMLKTELKDQVADTALRISRRIGYQGGLP